MTDADSDITRFGHLVRRYLDVLNGDSTDLTLLRELRTALADLYAAALHLPAPAEPPGSSRNVELVTDAQKVGIVASLVKRLPREMYWSALLPLTYLTVGDAGVKQLADDLSEIYSWLAPGLRLLEALGPTRELEDWWFDWDTYWGTPAIRCIAILHEVIIDLDLEIYGRAETPS